MDKLLTAQDIDNNQKSINELLIKTVNDFIKTRLRKKLKEIRESLKANDETEDISKEKIEEIKNELINDSETLKYRNEQELILLNKKNNFFILRQNLQDLNELNEFSAEIERNKLQDIENFLKYEDIVYYSKNKLELFYKIIKVRKTNIENYINYYKDKELLFNTDSLNLLLIIRELYKIDKDIDDIDLYEKYGLESNIDMSNKLADIYLKKYSENIDSTNIINEFAKNSANPIEKLIKSEIINNKMLGILLLSGKNRNSFVTNNSITCLKNTYITTKTNKHIYNTRTIGELLFEITNSELENVSKENRQQIYMSYDGTRPISTEYYKWSGLQIFDIDLKHWNGNMNYLKTKIFEMLQDFHWFLWICKSASGNGIHIYTKVTPPHHVYTTNIENNYISEYWFNISYNHKLSIIYDILYRLNQDKNSGINFPNNYFIPNDNGLSFELSNKIPNDNAELKPNGVDNTVGRITTGIRLTYDKKPLINNNFLDLHIGLGLSQTLDGYNYEASIKNILLRQTKINDNNIEKINNLANFELNVVKSDEIKISDYIHLGTDIENVNPLNKSSINYMIRYNVCNTLASLFGKEGLPIAHLLLASKECGNVQEINHFYSCAISNKKQPSKIGIDILKKSGIIKSIEPEAKVIIDNNYKNHIKKMILNSIDNKLIKENIQLLPNEFLSDKEEILLNPNKGGLTNSKINIVFSPPGTGKCFGVNTPILMYDCSTKMVQDIVVGDVLMGWDSKPRNVISTIKGQEEMFKIIPSKGESWTCNKSHILSLHTKNGYKPKILNIELSKYLELNTSTKYIWRLFHNKLEFDEQYVDIDPYFLGYWLGDGTENDCEFTIGNKDIDIVLPTLNNYVKQFDCELKEYSYDYMSCPRYRVKSKNFDRQYNNRNESNKNTVFIKFEKYNLIGNKHIPKEFLYNSKENRLQLFAGIIDSDGTVSNKSYCISITKKYLKFKNDLIFLARSLGYYVNCSEKTIKLNGKNYENWFLTISGNFKNVPVLYDRKIIIPGKKTYTEYINFDVKSIGIGNYYGFQLDNNAKDKMFLLSDFTVVHNTEFIKTLAKKGRRILLVLPYISVIRNKIETDEVLMKMFDCYYGTKDIRTIEYGINAVTTFDKFSKSNYEKISKMFDYIFIDESHLLFISSYRIEATSNVIKKIKELFFISINDPFSAKLCLLTGTETGESYFFNNVANIIRVNKDSLQKTMEFIICDDILDSITRLANHAKTLINDGYKLLIPTNKGEIYSEKIIGMLEFLLKRPVKYGYYKRSNTEQEICRLINDSNTVGDYEVIFCSNYLSVGVDIDDGKRFKTKFASIYLGPFSGYEIEQFNARIRKTGIRSVYCIQTQKADGTTNDLLLYEPNLLLHITEEDKENFLDDKSIANAKQEFIAQYDPVLHKITTPGFSYLNGKIRFNLEEYELISFENKYNECMQHPIRVARELSKYGYKILVNDDYEGLPISEQEELKAIGISAAKDEKIRKHSLYIGTFIDLVTKNNFVNSNGLEFTNIIAWIGKNQDLIIEDRELVDKNNQECFVYIEFDLFATPISVRVKSKEALDLMYKPAKYLISKYSVTKAIDIINQYVDENGILKQKLFKRAINLLKLVDSSDANELTTPLVKMLEKMYDFIDKFEIQKEYRIGYNTYQATVDEWTNSYIDMLDIKINTTYGYEKLKDSLIEMLADIASKSTSKNGIRFSYNKLPDQDSSSVLNRRSVDSMVERMFNVTTDIIYSNKKTSRNKHIILTKQNF